MIVAFKEGNYLAFQVIPDGMACVEPFSLTWVCSSPLRRPHRLDYLTREKLKLKFVSRQEHSLIYSTCSTFSETGVLESSRVTE